MSNSGVSTVGARLSLLNTPAFVRDGDAAASTMDKLAASLDKVAAASDRAAAGVGKTDAATAATKDTAAASAAITTAHTEQALAADAAAAATGRATKAVTAHKSALDSLASNSVVKKGAVVGLGLAGAAYEFTKMYADYQSKITQLVTQANIPMGDKNYYLKEGVALSDQLGVNVNSVADAYYRVASSATALHLSKQQITEYTKSSLELGVLAGGNMTPSQIENSSRVIGSMMNAQLKGATTPAQITALINSAVGSGDIRMSDMIGSIGKGGLSAAHQVGVSAPDLMAWIDSMTKLGGSPSQSGTLVSHAIQQMAGGSAQEQKVEQMIGINPGQLQSIMSKQGVGQAMQFLQNSMQHFNPVDYFPKFGQNAPGRDSAMAQLQAWGIMTPQEMATWTSGGTLSKDQQANVTNQLAGKMFGGARQETPEQVILSGQIIGAGLGTSQYSKLDATIKAAATPQAFAAALAQAENTPKFQMQRAESQMKNVGITIGQEITPKVTAGMKVLGDVGSYLASHQAVLMGGLAVLVGYSAAALAVRAANHVANTGKSIGKIFNTVRGVGGKLAGAEKVVGAVGPEGIFSAAVDEFTMAVGKFAISGGAGGLLGGAEKGATNFFDKNGFPIAKSATSTAVTDILGGGASTAATTAGGTGGGVVSNVVRTVTGGGASAVPGEIASGAGAVGTFAAVVAPLAASAALGALFHWAATYGAHNPDPNAKPVRIRGTHITGTVPNYKTDPNKLNVQGNPQFGQAILNALWHPIVNFAHNSDRTDGGFLPNHSYHAPHVKGAPLSPAAWSAMGMALAANHQSSAAHAAAAHMAPYMVAGGFGKMPVHHVADPLSSVVKLPSFAELNAAGHAHAAAAAKVAEAAGLSKEGATQLKDASKDEKAASKTHGVAADKLKASADAHLAAAAALQAAAASISSANAGGAAVHAGAIGKFNADKTALK